MLTIRSSQMEAFKRAAVERFELRTLAEMQRHDARKFQILGPIRARELVRAAVLRAEKINVEQDKDLLTFALCDFLLGAPFEQVAELGWARRLLADPKVSPGGKMEMVRLNVLIPAIEKNAARKEVPRA